MQPSSFVSPLEIRQPIKIYSCTTGTVHLYRAGSREMQELCDKDHSKRVYEELAVGFWRNLVRHISQIEHVPRPDAQMVFVGAKENKI